MTSLSGSIIINDYSGVGASAPIELEERKPRLPLPTAPQIPQENDIHAVHVIPKDDIIAILKIIHENPNLRQELIRQFSDDHPLSPAAKEFLNEDLTSSLIYIQDNAKAEEWLYQKNHQIQVKEEDEWYPQDKPTTTSSFKYSYIVTTPFKAVCWTINSIDKIVHIAKKVMLPIGIAVTIAQSPLTPVILHIIKKMII